MGLAFVYSLIYIYAMSAFAEYIAWALVAFIQIGLLSASGFLFYNHFTKKQIDTAVTADGKPVDKNSLLALGFVFLLLALIFGLMIYCGFGSL